MRLSTWRAAAPERRAVGPTVVALLDRTLAALGTEPDPWCWVAWGDDPATRFTVLAPIPTGLVVAVVRVDVAGEGPRISAKVVRWPRLQVGELALETSEGRLLLSVPVEGIVLRGVDEEAARIAAFVRVLIAGVDDRPWPPLDEASPKRRGRAAASTAGKAGEVAKAARPAAPAGSSRPARTAVPRLTSG